MKIIGIMSNARQCHNCGRVRNLNHMYYLKRTWYCCVACYNNHKEKTDAASDTLPSARPRPDGNYGQGGTG